MSKTIKIITFDTQKNKDVVAGFYYPDSGNFEKKVKQSNYMLKESGYGIQNEVMRRLSQVGCQFISVLIDNKIYRTRFTEWFHQGNIKNYGHGLQNFYPLELMTLVKEK